MQRIHGATIDPKTEADTFHGHDDRQNQAEKPDRDHPEEFDGKLMMARQLGIQEDLLFVSLLKSCARTKDLNKGTRLHNGLLRRGALEKNPHLVSALITMYAKCGDLTKARTVLELAPDQNVVCWNALISGYIQDGQAREALNCFEQMQTEGFLPNNVTFICALKACGTIRALEKGKELHDEIAGMGLLNDVVLGTALVDMYAKCGNLAKAQQVLEEIPHRNVVTWSALISGYAQQGQLNEALDCFDKMQAEGLSPNDVTFICILKACGDKRATENGKQIHYEIVSRGLLDVSIMVGNALVDMYAKCGMISEAQKVLEKLPFRNTISWSSLISGFVLQDQGREALKCFELMQNEGLSPDSITFISILKACGDTRDLNKGIGIHRELLSRNLLEKDIVLSTALVDMYAKCNALDKAKKVLKELPVRDVIAWNAFIAGCVQHGQCHEAWTSFECMQSEGLYPSISTFVCILKVCSATGALEDGIQIHRKIASEGLFIEDILLGNALVDMYAKCGVLPEAYRVLEELPLRNTSSWNSLIAGYNQWGQGQKTLDCFEMLQSEGLTADALTFSCIMKACGSVRDIVKAFLIHEQVVNRGLLEKDVAIGNALVDMYAKLGLVGKALEVLEKLPFQGVVAWNSVIAGYVEQGQCHEAFKCFEWMKKEHLHPDIVTFISILKACGSTGDVKKGKQIHDEIFSRGLLGTDIVLDTALLDMYAKCGEPARAWNLLEQIPSRDIISWNSVISGYAQQGLGYEALNTFECMRNEGFSSNAVTFICILKACSTVGDLEKGKQIHNQVKCKGLLERDIALGNALVDMYSKCGIVKNAEQVVEELPIRNIVSWNTLIALYAQYGQCHEAFKCFNHLQKEDFCPDALTFISLLKACGNSGAMCKGEQIHHYYVTKDLLAEEIALGNALVDMYAKCGAFAKAHQVLEGLPVRNVVSWNALIAGYAQQRQGHEALNCFEQMKIQGTSPDEVTFLGVLSACGHSGQLDEAQFLFRNMAEKYSIVPQLEHHTCMVSVLGYAGHFNQALSVIKLMPSHDYPSVWLALLSGCAKWENDKLGKLVFDQIVKLDYTCAPAYVFMATIFAAVHMPEDAEKLEALRLKYDYPSSTQNLTQKYLGADPFTITITDSQNREIHEKMKTTAPSMLHEGYNPNACGG